ncbi:dipeptide epimerase [Tengunoibacter tsumagoiensis]|uniref:Dipeptide epimerase n=1 Tax=Tengunoibacter tsumagoiensis TaxID=2014871 RepID=A0A402A3W9_9CHLR|nr:dipeptide epimerase [Tengunoibacter tsumagoiensis]GCE13847.1 dipeptide epimerase [Tengunoibacter tsumagoiensis]
MIHIDAKPISLQLTTPFRISRSVQQTASNVVVQLKNGEAVGYGEAAPNQHYGESAETVLACIAQFAGNLGNDPFQIEDIMQRLDKVIRLNPAAKACVDMALYDMVGKILGIPLYKFLGLNPSHMPRTSFTIGLDTPTEMARKALMAKDYPILKIKVGTRHDLEILKAIRDVSSAVIRVDANAGWTPKEAIKNIHSFLEYGVEFVEQPVAGHDLAGLKMVREHVSIPIIADESCVVIEDIPRLSECVDGVNLKLMKNGGIHTILKMIHVARAHHLRVMLGCMIESSLAITAAAHLAPLVDYIDLDGNLLISDDPYRGAKIENGRLQLPSDPGLGVKLHA